MKRAIQITALIASFGLSFSPELLASGFEFQVNRYTFGSQYGPHVAVDPSGNFVVVWDDNQRDRIRGQIFDSSGARVGKEFRANGPGTGAHSRPRVAIDASGNFAVVWVSDGLDGSGLGVFGRLFDSSGTRQGREFMINTVTIGDQRDPEIAMDAKGRFVVTWEGPSPASGEIFARRFDSLGMPDGPEFQVNSFTTGTQCCPAIAMNETGEFVVIWSSNPLGSADVIGQRFDSNGAFDGKEFRVDSPTRYAIDPDVALNGSGQFVVVWAYLDSEIRGRPYDAGGIPLGSEFTVGGGYRLYPQRPSVGIDDEGEFVVAWQGGNVYYRSTVNVWGRSFEACGSPAEPERRLNVHTQRHQRFPSLGMNPAGDFIVVWNSYLQDGSSWGVFARPFTGARFCVSGDRDFDAICDADDIVIRRPRMRDEWDCRRGAQPPQIRWATGPFDHFRAFVSSGYRFPDDTSTITSGKEFIEASSWMVPGKRWERVCAEAEQELFVKILGVDDDEPRDSLGRRTESNIVRVGIRK